MDLKICDVTSCQTVISAKNYSSMQIGKTRRDLCDSCHTKLQHWIMETFLHDFSEVQAPGQDNLLDEVKVQQELDKQIPSQPGLKGGVDPFHVIGSGGFVGQIPSLAYDGDSDIVASGINWGTTYSSLGIEIEKDKFGVEIEEDKS